MPIDPAVYNEFIDGLEIVDIRLVSARVQALREYVDTPLVATIDSDEASFVHDAGKLTVSHTLEFRGTPEGISEPALVATATFAITYTTRCVATDEIFEVFRRRNLPVNTWPYFREFVHNIIGRTGWPKPMLPALKTGVRGRSRATAGASGETHSG